MVELMPKGIILNNSERPEPLQRDYCAFCDRAAVGNVYVSAWVMLYDLKILDLSVCDYHQKVLRKVRNVYGHVTYQALSKLPFFDSLHNGLRMILEKETIKIIKFLIRWKVAENELPENTLKTDIQRFCKGLPSNLHKQALEDLFSKGEILKKPDGIISLVPKEQKLHIGPFPSSISLGEQIPLRFATDPKECQILIELTSRFGRFKYEKFIMPWAWQETQIDTSNLPAGNYQLKIIARSPEDGTVLCEKTKDVQIKPRMPLTIGYAPLVEVGEDVSISVVLPRYRGKGESPKIHLIAPGIDEVLQPEKNKVSYSFAVTKNSNYHFIVKSVQNNVESDAVKAVIRTSKTTLPLEANFDDKVQLTIRFSEVVKVKELSCSIREEGINLARLRQTEGSTFNVLVLPKVKLGKKTIVTKVLCEVLKVAIHEGKVRETTEIVSKTVKDVVHFLPTLKLESEPILYDPCAPRIEGKFEVALLPENAIIDPEKIKIDVKNSYGKFVKCTLKRCDGNKLLCSFPVKSPLNYSVKTTYNHEGKELISEGVLTVRPIIQINILNKDTVASNPRVMVGVNPKIPLANISFRHGKCFEPLELDSKNRNSEDPTRVILLYKPTYAQKISNFTVKVHYQGVENETETDLIIRPQVAILKVTPAKRYYFPGEEIIFDVDTSKGINAENLRVEGLGGVTTPKVNRLQDQKFRISLLIPPDTPPRTHKLAIQAIVGDINSLPAEKKLAIRGASVEIQEPREGFQVGDPITVKIHSPTKLEASVRRLYTKESFPLSLKATDDPYTYIGKITLPSHGVFIVQANGLRSKKFAIYPYLQLSCLLLKRNRYMLLGPLSDYIVRLETNKNVELPSLKISLTDPDHNPIPKMTYKFLDLPMDQVRRRKRGKFLIIEFPLNLIIHDLDALEVGTYYLQVTVAPGRRSKKLIKPPHIECEETISGIFTLSDSLKIPIKAQTDSKIMISVEAHPSPERFLIPPIRRKTKSTANAKEKRTSLKFSLNSLYPGVMYDIFVTATLNEIESPAIDLGDLALVEAFPYEESYHRQEKMLIIVHSPPRISVKLDGKRIGKSPLPITVIRRDVATKRPSVTFADTFVKYISYDIDKPLIQPDVRILKSINKLSLIKADFLSLPQIQLKHKSKSAEHCLERALKNDENDIVFTERDTRSRAESYIKPITDYCLRSEELGTKAVVIFPSNALYQEQLSKIVDYLWKINKHHEVTLGLMPSPTPYAEPYFDLEKANRVEKEAKISPSMALPCPSCGRLGKYVMIRLQDLNVGGCVECGFSPSVAKTVARKLKVDKTDVKNLDLDEERSEAYIRTAKERYGPFPYYTPVLLNSVLHCPKCEKILIPVYRINPDTEEEEQALACPKCGLSIDFVSFTLMKLRCFPPDIVLMSAPICRWLFQTSRGSLFNNFYGKVRLCNKCGRMHTISKPIGRVDENLVKHVLYYVRDNFPSHLREAHEQYLEFRHEKRRRGAIKESFVELVQAEEQLDKLRTKVLSLGGTIDTNVKKWIKKRLENLESKSKLLELEGVTSRRSEMLKEQARVKKEIVELRRELKEKEVLVNKLEAQINKIRGKAEWQAKFTPLIKIIHVVLVLLGLKWTSTYLRHQELSDSLSQAQRQIKQIKKTLQELSRRDETIKKLRKEKALAEIELRFVEEEIKSLHALKEDYENVVDVILGLGNKLSFDIGDLFTISTIDEAVGVIRKELCSINFSLYKILVEYEKAKEEYDEMKKEWRKRIEKWIFERLYEKEMSVIEIENTIDDAIACLKGCGFIDHLYSVTSRGQRFLKGDKTQINSCKCGGSYQRVMIKPRYIVFDDFHHLWFSRFDTMREEPALRLLRKIKKETNARLIVSLRRPQMK